MPTFSTFNRADGYVPSTDTTSRSNGSSREDRLKRHAVVSRWKGNTASHCGVEDAATAVNLSLSFNRSLSPFFSPALYALSNGLEAAKANAGNIRRGGARLFTYLCRGKMKPLGVEIGEVSLRSGAYNPDPISPPTCPPSPHLITQTVMSHPLTPRRAAMAAPEKTASKDAPGVVSRWKGNPPSRFLPS